MKCTTFCRNNKTYLPLALLPGVLGGVADKFTTWLVVVVVDDEVVLVVLVSVSLRMMLMNSQ